VVSAVKSLKKIVDGVGIGLMTCFYFGYGWKFETLTFWLSTNYMCNDNFWNLETFAREQVSEMLYLGGGLGSQAVLYRKSSCTWETKETKSWR
jgi:hypothetical protein